MVSGSPYGDTSQVMRDVPKIDDRDKNTLNTYNTESSADIDTILRRYPVSVPLTGTIPTTITNATNLRIKARYFLDTGEIDRGMALMKLSDNLVTAYGMSITQNNPEAGTLVVSESSYQSSELSGQ